MTEFSRTRANSLFFRSGDPACRTDIFRSRRVSRAIEIPRETSGIYTRARQKIMSKLRLKRTHRVEGSSVHRHASRRDWRPSKLIVTEYSLAPGGRSGSKAYHSALRFCVFFRRFLKIKAPSPPLAGGVSTQGQFGPILLISI